MQNRFTYTAVISAFNEEHRLEIALRNFYGRANILVIDNFSTDRTLEIARKYTNLVYQRTNPGWMTPECYRFRFEMSPTDYVLITNTGQLHPLPLLELYDRVSRERSHCGVVCYSQVYSYGVPVSTYGRPYRNPAGACKFFNKCKVNLDQGVIHAELPLDAGPDRRLRPPRELGYCIFSFRDDDAASAESKHTRYAAADAAARFAVGERTFPAKWVWVFSRQLLGCLFLRGAIKDGPAGAINSFYRAVYFVSIQIRLWELQNNQKGGSVAARHNQLKLEIIERLESARNDEQRVQRANSMDIVEP